MEGLEVSYPRLVEKKALRNLYKSNYCQKWLLSSQAINFRNGECNREVNRDKGNVKPWMDTLGTVGRAGRERIGGFFPSELLVIMPVHCNWEKAANKGQKAQCKSHPGCGGSPEKQRKVS